MKNKVEEKNHHTTADKTIFILTVICIVVLMLAFIFFAFISVKALPDKAKYVATQKAIERIEIGLVLYFVEVGEYPSTKQGLDALWRRTDPTPKNWYGPYVLYPISTDPWGFHYAYRNPGTRFGYEYDLLSFGRDVKLGGTGFDADIWVGDTTKEVKVQNMVTRNAILDQLSRTRSTPCKKLGDKLKLPQTNTIGQVTKECSKLIYTLHQMCAEGLIEWIEREGIIRRDF